MVFASISHNHCTTAYLILRLAGPHSEDYQLEMRVRIRSVLVTLTFNDLLLPLNFQTMAMHGEDFN